MRVLRLTFVALLAALMAASIPAVASQGSGTTASTVTGIPAGETTTFVDVTLIGRDPSELLEKWIRFVTATNPDGIVTRVQGFNPATGQFTVHDAIPAGAVAAGDGYLVGSTPWAVGASGTSNFLMASSEPGCQPAGTIGPDVIVCTGTDTTGVVSEDGADAIVVTDGAAVDVADGSLIPEPVRTTRSATAIDTGSGDDSVLNAGVITADTTGVLLPLLTPPSPVPGLSLAWGALIQVDVESKGIDGASGNDELTNTGTIAATSSAVVLPSTGPVNIPGLSSADVSSTAKASATGIEGGDGDDSLANSGSVSASATSESAGVGISFVSVDEDARGGKSKVKGNVTANAAAAGVSAGAGDDTLTNSSTIDATASAGSLAITGAALSVKGNAAVSAKSTADAKAAAVDMGAGDDVVVNDGSLAASAAASAESLSVAIAVPDDSNPTGKLKSAVSGGATAKSRAIGIGADGWATETELEPELSNDGETLSLELQVNQTLPAGNDVVTNHGDVTATATAAASSTGVGFTVDGATSVRVKSSAEATSAAIDLGAGDDTLTNTGTLTSVADATSDALSLAIGVKTDSSGTPPGDGGGSETPAPAKVKVKAVADGSAKATARATGISADSTAEDVSRTVTLTVGDGVGLHLEETKAHTGGDDEVINEGSVAADATATTSATGIGVTINGAASAKVTSTADAQAVGIELGGGDDTLTNTGTVTATADATAGALNVAVGVQADSSEESETPGTPAPAVKSAAAGGATARARATGIAGDSVSGDTTRSIDLTLGGDDAVVLAYSERKTHTVPSDADPGDPDADEIAGDDYVINDGGVTATATSTTTAGGVGVTIGGEASANARSTSEADAVAVDLGGGDDQLTNTGTLAATADATATSLNLAVGVTTDSSGTPPAEGETSSASVKAAVDGSAKAQAHAVGVSADGAPDTFDTVTLTIGGGIGMTYEQTKTHASGDDIVTNSGDIDASATATTVGVGVGVSVGGEAAASVTSTAVAEAAGIDLGAGDDTLTNTGTLTAAADAEASALNVAVGVSTGSSSSESAVDGSAKAEARATGLAADSLSADLEGNLELTIDLFGLTFTYDELQARAGGDDTVTNDGAIAATATAYGGVAGVGVTIDGNAAAKAESTGDATAVGVDLGGGADQLVNTGEIAASADATARALNVAVGVATGSSGSEDPPATPPTPLKSAAEGSATAQARAMGVAADGAAPDLERTVTMEVWGGIALGLQEIKTDAASDDTVTNTGAIEATAVAATDAVGVSVTIDGAAAAKITSTAEADAAGVDLGGGNDTLTNTGAITADADATARALNVAVGVSSGSSESPGPKTKSAADGSATAKARATGVAADSLAGDTDRGLEIQIDDIGLGIVYHQRETRVGGDDVVVNDGDVEARATALSQAGGAAITVKGAASANSKSTSEATATAIDLGGGGDTLTNTGALTAVADSTAQALKAGISSDGGATASDGLWNGGIKAEANATGIDGAGSGDTSTEVEVILDSGGLYARYETRKDDVTGDGDDVITNHGDIDAQALATSQSANVAITAEGTAAAVSNVEVKAEATGIRAGQGDDVVENLGAGQMSVSADGEAQAVSIAVSGKGAAIAADALWSGGTQAEASAVGIDADGGAIESTLVTVTIDGSGVEVVHEKSETAASGDDVVVNEQDVDVSATATGTSIGVALEAKKGVGAAISSVSSEADSTAIRGGDGDDSLTNRGALTSTATSTADATSVAFAAEGLAVATNSVWDGGTKAQATAVGIDADGGNVSEVTNTTVTVDGSGATIVHTKTEHAASGDDAIVNEGDIDATATATALQTAVAATGKGLSAAVSQSSADAAATAIRGGDGDDEITNSGRLTSTATATAEAGNVALTFEKGGAIAGNAVWDGGVTAEAVAIGIEGDGGNRESVSITTITTGGGGSIGTDASAVAARGDDVIVNSGQIDAIALAEAPAVSVGIAVQGVAGAISTATAKSSASAIDAGDGDDQVTNTGVLNADSTAFAVAINGSGVSKGVAIAANDSWDGGVNADARARGIDGGAGFDNISNDAEVRAHSEATAPAVTAAVAITGVPVAVSTSTATSDATAIDAGGGVEADEIVNLAGGTLTAHAEAEAYTANVAVTNQGLAVAADAVWDGGTTAEALAKGIDSGNGADTITNDGTVDATADATAASASVAVAITGVAGAIATSTAESTAIAIDSGEGQDDDEVTNTGDLTATSNALAAAASVGVTNAGVSVAAGALWDGGTTSRADATGIRTGGGVDTVVNEGEIDALADAATGTAAVSVAVSGVAAAIATSTAESRATAIDAGQGADDIVNRGRLLADADATAGTVTVGVTTAGVSVAGDAAWDGGTKGIATAIGIAGGGGADTMTNDGDIEADSDAITTSVAVSVALSGLAGAVGTSTAVASSTAIDGGEGNDAITNLNAHETGRTGTLTANADAVATAATVTVTLAGVAVAADAVWEGGTTAEATAKGIDAGSGADTVFNESDIDAQAHATTVSAAVAFALEGVAGAIANASGTSSATAIHGGDSNDPDEIVNTGALGAAATTHAVSAAVGFTKFGVSAATNSFWDGGTTGDAFARGIFAGLGADSIVNAGEIEAVSDANAVSATVAANVAGVAAAVSTATANARSTAIDGGDGDDTIENLEGGTLTAEADATGVAVNIAVTAAGVGVAGDSVWDGGTKANATARGIDGGKGRDAITNDATVRADAHSITSSNAVIVSLGGVTGATATSTSTATAVGIDGGDDADVIDNRGDVAAVSEAEATGVSVNVTGVGAALASDAIWDGGTKANASATGIAGGAGDDAIENTADIVTADATATTHSVSVAVTAGGLAGAAASSTATARSTAIDGGTGADDILHDGALVSTAASEAAGVSVSVALQGAAIAGAFLDNLTKAESIATGVAGGTGDDRIATAEQASIALASSAETADTTVTVSAGGFAGSDTEALAIARAIGLDGGDGEDVLENQGAIDGEATAVSRGRSVAVSLGEASGSASGTAEAIAVGLDGGNDDDVVTNDGEIRLSSLATAEGQTIDVGILNVAAAGEITGAAGVGRATAVGLAGGEGDDVVLNRGTMTLLPTAQATGQQVNVSSAGASVSDASALAQAFATGIDGGLGNDTLTNAGSISATVSAATTARSTGVVVFGASLETSNAEAEATAIGIDGGDDGDLIANAVGAIIDIAAQATTEANGVNVSVFGASGGGAQTSPLAAVVGLEGGAGDDEIVNDGTIAGSATATSSSSNSSTNIFGSAGGTVGTTATAGATGISGGDGDDRLLNRFLIDLEATSSATVSGSSWSLAGASSGSSVLSANSLVEGIAGGAGADWIRNEEDVFVTLTSTLSATGGSDAIFGSASADTQLRALAQGIGLTGGDGGDTIENVSLIDVDSRANVTATRASVSFAGSPSTDALLVSQAQATGMDGGADADSIRNQGVITVDAASTTNVSGGTKTTFGGTSTGGFGTAEAAAVGLQGGAGTNVVRNTGLADVDADAEAIVSNSANSGWIVGQADTRAEARATASAAGLSAGDGDNQLVNDGELRVLASGAGFGFAYASGAHLSFNGDGEALADGRAFATAIGLSAGNGGNVIVNNGLVNVSAVASTLRNLTTTTNICSEEVVTVQDECTEEEQPDVCVENPDGTTTCTPQPPILVCPPPRQETVRTCEDQEIVLQSTPTFANANGNGLDGDGQATARATARAEAYGIRAGSGDNLIVNTGELIVTASPDARARSFADGDVFGDATGSATANATATAIGIAAGNGSNDIRNTGTITVLAEPTAQAITEVTGGDGICITFLFWTWCGGEGDSSGTSTATFTAQATGILAGSGNNRIINDGTISVTSAPAVDGFAARVGGADGPVVRTTVTSRAVGIKTGDGDNEILNAEGALIDVVARDASVCNGTCTPPVLEAIGIQTGAGDDLIVNDGTIATSIVPRTGAPTAGVAIDSGGGDDTVVLGVGSSTTGTVLLGTGSDTLVWSALATLNGIAFGGTGTDIFALGGAVDADFAMSEIGVTFREFELFHKRGPSTWGLLGDRRINWTVDEGTLAVKGVVTGTIDTSIGAVDAIIAVTPGGIVRRDDALTPAVLLNGGGTLINDGLVEAATPGGIAVSAVGSGNHIVNNSLISGPTGIHMDGSDNTVVNDGLVLSLGAAGAGIVLAGDGNSLINRGTVSAQGTAVQFSTSTGAGGHVLNESGGHILSTGGVAIQGGDGDDRVENHGRVTGGAGVAIAFAGGDDELLISASSDILGAVQGGDGFDTMVLGGTQDAAFDLGDIGPKYQEFELFGKQGSSTWTLFGEAASDWRVDEGTLAIEGSVWGSIATSLGAINPIISVLSTGIVRNDDPLAAIVLNGGATLTNEGLIQSTAGGGVALQALGVNQISNSGEIRALGVGVQVMGDGNRFSNVGAVLSTGNAGAAVSMTGEGNSIANTGLIEGGFGGLGVTLTGQAGSITNTGDIRSGGLAVMVTGAGGSLANSGVIAGAAGVQMHGGQAQVSNGGSILARGIGVGLYGSGGTIFNAGSIVSDGGTEEAIAIAGNDNTLLNDGSITGAGGGITIEGFGNAITNRGAVAAGGIGIQVTGGQSSILNSGQISAGGAGVSLGGGGGTLSNFGAIESSGGPAILGGAGNDRVENYGTLTGTGVAVDLGAGQDTLLIVPGSQIAGLVHGGDGSDLLNLAGGGLGHVDLSTFTGFETLRKDDLGAWVLAGSGDMDWSVTAGGLIVEGNLSQAGTVHAGGWLAGSGTVGGLVNEGTVAPGSSIGTLKVQGDYQHGASATLEIEGSITGLSDRIEVSGQALLNGGSVTVLPETRRYGVATEYTILTAAGGITGAFGSASSGLDYLDAFLDNDPNTIFLTLIRNDISFHKMADTTNLQAVGAALDLNKKAMARGDFKGLMDQFLDMDEAQQRSALFALTGELHATTSRALLRTGQRFFSAAVDRQLSARRLEDENKTFWADAFGFSGRVDGDGNAGAARYRAVGFATGVDIMVTDATRIGGSFGFSPGSSELDRTGGGKANVNSYHPALYGEHVAGRWNLEMGAGYSRHQVSTSRDVVVGPVARRAAADYHADQFTGLLRAGFDLVATPTASVEPFGELRYSKLTRRGFSESGAESANLTETRSGSTESLRSVLGVGLGWQPSAWGMRFAPQIKVGWAHESLDDGSQLTSSLNGALAAAGFHQFTIAGLTEARDAAILMLGGTMGFSTSSEGFVTYDGNLTGRGTEHGFVAGLRIAW